ncbi:hypothetical protein [Thermocatellispora tengchongensis]|nr:hypothetical protein [Thermocatellispora tengchongensis]
MDLTASPRAATELQRSAEALLAHLAAGGTTPFALPRINDVEGYWLPPAIEALMAITAGEEALEALTRAAQRDERRTALFLCLALAVAGQGDRIHASWLGIAFGDLSAEGPVTHGQRALWVAAARGAYGPAGKIFVLRKLDAVAVPAKVDADRWLGSLVPSEPAVVVPRSFADFPELAEIPALARPAQAAARLARLRGRCAEITAPRRPGDGSRTPAASSHDEPLAVLRMLVGSGGPERPMGTLTSHLLDDLSPGADPDLAACALHVVAPIVRRVAEELAQATHLDPPSTVTIPILGHDVVLRPEGPDPASLASAEARIGAQGVPRRPHQWWPAYAALGSGAVALLAAFVTTLLLLVAAVVLGAAGAYLLHRARLQQEADEQYVASQLSELRELAEGAVWALHEYAREAAEKEKAAATDLAELTRLIRRGPRAA